MKPSKLYAILLWGLGISQLGNWIYLIALNVTIWELTHSPAAVAGLYLIGPGVRIICSFFVGSYVDRMNKKVVVITADIWRGILVLMMPFLTDIFFIYSIVAFTNIAGAFFNPSSTYLIATHVNDADKQRFNALHATLNSGAFMIGPALAGIFLSLTNTTFTMWINALTFFVCAWLLSYLPNVDVKSNSERVSFQTISNDWRLSLAYLKKRKGFSTFLLIYSIALMIAYSLDSQEMTYLLSNINISKGLYGLSVTMAGIGAVIGGIVAAACAKNISTSTFVKVGFLLSMLSYLGFYLSQSYFVAISCFVALGIFMAFSNSGFSTIFQIAVQPEIIGRVSGVLSLAQSLLQMIFTLSIGLFAQLFDLQVVAACFATIAFLLALIICKVDFCSRTLNTNGVN